MRPLTDSTNFQSDGNQLRVRTDADGYLLIRDLLPSALIEEVAAELALTMAEAGWILADEPLSKALADV